MKSKMILGAVLGAVMSAGAALAADKEIMIGYQAPFSGDRSQYGEMFRNAAAIKLAEFNASGKLPGATVSIAYEDSKDDPKEARNIARKFLDNPKIVGVIGDFSSTVSMAAAEIYATEKMPQLSQTASHPDFTKISPWQFRNITTQAFEGPYNADWILSKGLKTAAVIYIQNDWGISALEGFVDGYKAKGGKIVATETFNPGNRDFRSILTKVARQKPDVIYLAMFYEEGAALAQQREQLGITIPLYGTSSLYSPKLIELGRASVNDLHLATTFTPDNPDPAVQTFVKEYVARHKAEPSMFAAQAYDAVGIMLDAVAAAGPSVTRETLRDALAKTTNYPGVTGATSFDPATREPTKSLAKMVVKDGKFQVIGEP
ncbi:ABC transporter substrate-binding protein [Azospirillum soli]|uniref:ABC transporter substrate-binding protein n=1 Tax=Azospirillum soli TaxID=1304799 RepID=UPI001AE10F2F|nr:ABC transporter substrate-binding protein [Azospirillum soli]MBP2314689.1 branched-chain amino acid transport system substrate-binding protein [Azospirillum soli]